LYLLEATSEEISSLLRVDEQKREKKVHHEEATMWKAREKRKIALAAEEEEETFVFLFGNRFEALIYCV
jgi:hypothetical protein